ncbi:MAG: Hsp20/alpha crystallin family protein [Candidatus Hodarchaeota archaeon]
MCHGTPPPVGKGFAFDCGPHFFGPRLGNLIHHIAKEWKQFWPHDLAATDDQYILTMPLPGWEVKDVEVSIKGNNILVETLRPETEKVQDGDDKSLKFLPLTKFWNRPNVHVTVPVEEEIDPESVKAKLARGILEIRFNKKPGKKIDVIE